METFKCKVSGKIIMRGEAVSFLLVLLLVPVSTFMTLDDAFGQTVLAGRKLALTVTPDLPFNHVTDEKVTLKFQAQGMLIKHADYLIKISKDGPEIFKMEFHDHDGILELEVHPQEMLDFEVDEPIENDANKLNTSAFIVRGPLFLSDGMYDIDARITGIEFKPLTDVIKQEFSINVVPEFPGMAVLPLLLALALASIIAFLRVKSKYIQIPPTR